LPDIEEAVYESGTEFPAMTKGEFGISAMVLLALGGFFLGFSGSVDDAHITFWAAQALGDENQILNYNFERVEQSSALSQVLLLALLHAASGMSVVILGHITTLLAALAALCYTGKLAQRIHPQSAGIAFLLLATSPFFVYWSFSGMEGPLLALLLVLFLIRLDCWLQEKCTLVTVFLLSMVVQMTRPEMPLVLCIFALALFPVRALLNIHAWNRKSLVALLLMQLACAGLLTGWRWWYFGDVVPQPVNAKIGSMSFVSLLQGLQYLRETVLDVRLLLPGALVVTGGFLVLLRWREPSAVLLVVLLATYSVFVIASGGDWMAAGRFWVPVTPLAMVLVALVLVRICTSVAMKNSLLLLMVAGNLMYLWRGTSVDFNGVPLWKHTQLVEMDRAADFSFFERHAREHLHDIPTLGFTRPLVEKLLAVRSEHGNAAPVNIMAGQMGMLPFYLAKDFGRRVHFFDRNGITERTLTDCPVAAALPRTRNGIGTGYEWIVENRAALESQCGFVMPDIVFDIETGWNRRNIVALEQAEYIFVYRQRGHVFEESQDSWLPMRKIGAGQFIAISRTVWEQLGKPAAVERNF
jgi:hypothetical protein